MWTKEDLGIKFAKHYRTSLKSITAIAVSEEGTLLATITDGMEGRVFDVINTGELGMGLG